MRSRPRGAQLDDVAVIEACLAGDEHAWAELVTRYSRLVHSVIRRHRLAGATADDVFQDVFTACVRQLPKIRRHTALPKWFITTTHRVCRKHYESARGGQATPPADLADVAEPPAELIEAWERQHLVGRALRSLGGRCRDLLTALYAEPSPVRYDELARRLEIPTGSIGPTRARCLKKLLAIIESLEEPGGPGMGTGGGRR